MPDLTEDEIGRTDFGTYTERPVLRRHVPGHALPHRPRALRAPGRAARFDDDALAARQRACASPRSGAARPSRSTAGSSSGAASRSKPGAAARGWSTSETAIAEKRRHRDPLRRARASRSLYDGHAVHRRAGEGAAASIDDVDAKSVVLACGGFEVERRDGAPATSARAGTSPRCAARASTPATASAWRSTSAPSPSGNWSGCHAVGWDCNAPEFGDLAVGDGFQKHSYPFGHHGQRRRAGASSTRAPTSATTPTPNTAA